MVMDSISLKLEIKASYPSSLLEALKVIPRLYVVEEEWNNKYSFNNSRDNQARLIDMERFERRWTLLC